MYSNFDEYLHKYIFWFKKWPFLKNIIFAYPHAISLSSKNKSLNKYLPIPFKICFGKIGEISQLSEQDLINKQGTMVIVGNKT